MIIKAPIKLIGNNGSPYTRKMVALLRYKHIPYKIIWGEPDEYLDRNNIEKPKPVLHPTFLFENSEKKITAVTDSTPISQFYTQHSYLKILKRKLLPLLTQPLSLES